MNIGLNDSERSLIDAAKAFAEQHIEPFAAEWESNRRVPREMFVAAADAGLTGVLVPRELGGRGARFATAARVLEELSSSCLAATFALWVHNNVVNGIARHGTRAQIDRLVEPMLRAQRIGAFCLTEPGAGSDATAITTRASEVDGGWRINGEKAWVTNGTHADLLVVYAQTDTSLGWRGIGSFLVDASRNGVSRTTPYELIGGHAMGVSGIRFDECEISGDDVLLGPGDGFKAAMSGINHARMCVGAVCCGVLGASLEYALAHAAKRHAFGKSVLSFQGLQWELADVATDLQAARLLTYDAAAALDRGEAAVTEAAHAKKFSSRVALSGISQCMQVMGAVGALMEHPPARHLATAKLTQYLDGTTEIQNIVISRGLLKAFGQDAG
jgi:alkylation response protein AidB-like acyl-CoA dehydrogenase